MVFSELNGLNNLHTHVRLAAFSYDVLFLFLFFHTFFFICKDEKLKKIIYVPLKIPTTTVNRIIIIKLTYCTHIHSTTKCFTKQTYSYLHHLLDDPFTYTSSFREFKLKKKIVEKNITKTL